MKRTRDDDYDDRDERDDRDEGDDRPRKKKKKKKKDAKSNANLYIMLAIGGGLLLTLLVCGGIIAIVVTRAGKEKLTPVTEWANYDTPEDVFHVDLPKGWDEQHGGKKNLYFVEAKRGGAKIRVNENIVGSLVADIADSQNPNREGGDDKLPVSVEHERKRKIYADDFSGYDEEPAVTILTGFGKTRRSTFTGRSGLTKVKGYRATAVGVQTQITVTCYCAESDWNMMEPAFRHVVESIGYGPGPNRR